MKIAIIGIALLIAQSGWADGGLTASEENLVYLGVSTLVNPTIHETQSILGAAEIIKQILAAHPIKDLAKEVRLPILKSVLTREKIHEGSETIFHLTGEIIESYVSQVTSDDPAKSKELAVTYSDDLKVLAREEGELFSNPLVKMDSDDTVAHRYVSYLRNALVSTCPLDTAKAIISAIKVGISLQKAGHGPISTKLLFDLDYAFRRTESPEIRQLILNALLETSIEHESVPMRQSAAELYKLLELDLTCAEALGT